MSATSSATPKAAPLSEWFEKLPAWGTTCGGELSAHPTPDYLTAVRDGSQLPLIGTPTQMDAHGGQRSAEFRRGRTPTPVELAADMARGSLLPTPTRWVQGEVDLDKYLARREREKAKGQNGNGFGMPLDMAVRLLPTPNASDGTRGPDLARPSRQLSGGPDLVTAVERLLPTTTSGASTPERSVAGS